MKKYKAKECRCWSKYPNKWYKKPEQWKCVDCYELVKQVGGNHKTICKLKEVNVDERR